MFGGSERACNGWRLVENRVCRGWGRPDFYDTAKVNQ